jgi:hypothetical protein
MTYAFEFRLPNVQEGTEEAEKELQRLKGVSSLPYFFLSFLLSRLLLLARFAFFSLRVLHKRNAENRDFLWGKKHVG